jgi:hypothetical protein
MNSSNSKPDKLTTEELELIEALLKYPSLERVFDKNSPDAYLKTKQKMTAVVMELERVMRRGTKQDAEKAKDISEAYKTALNFLNELEQMRKQQAK